MDISLAGMGMLYAILFAVSFVGTAIVGLIIKEQENAKRAAKTAAVWAAVSVVLLLALAGMNLEGDAGTLAVYIFAAIIVVAHVITAKWAYKERWERAAALSIIPALFVLWYAYAAMQPYY